MAIFGGMLRLCFLEIPFAARRTRAQMSSTVASKGSKRLRISSYGGRFAKSFGICSYPLYSAVTEKGSGGTPTKGGRPYRRHRELPSLPEGSPHLWSF
jgi:hypothetical protein